MKPVRQLAELYNRHRKAVFGYLFRMSGDRAEAEELTQETFYQAVLSIHRFRADASVQTWLLKVARNVFLKRLRRRGREQPVEDAEVLLEPGGQSLAGPEEQLLRDDDRAAVERVLVALPEAYRTVLVLREMEGLSHREIAQILNKTEATVRVLSHRARERFRALYLAEEAETP